MTLLELLVVLVLLGLAASLVVPALRAPAEATSGDDLFANARRIAAQRGETQHVTALGGTWQVTPAGLCLPDRVPQFEGGWDPVRCEVRPVAATSGAPAR